MKVILIDDVFELGRRGQIVKVANGFGRNFLIPRKLAIPATAGNVKAYEEQRIALAKKEAKFVEEAEILAQQLGLLHVIVGRKAGDTGVLFGSVTSKDISDALEGKGINLDRRRIMLKQPIKNIGNFTVEARPHNDVEAKILVSVTPEGDETPTQIIQRGEESDKIVAELAAKVAEIQRLTGVSQASEPIN